MVPMPACPPYVVGNAPPFEITSVTAIDVTRSRPRPPYASGMSIMEEAQLAGFLEEPHHHAGFFVLGLLDVGEDSLRMNSSAVWTNMRLVVAEVFGGENLRGDVSSMRKLRPS